MKYIEKLDFALSFFIGCENVDLIEKCKTEEEIEDILIHRRWEKK